MDFFKNLLLVSVTQVEESDENFICLTQKQASQILRKGNFYQTIQYVSEQIVYVNEEHVEWSVKFLEKFFEIEPEIFTDYLDKFKSIINKSNEVVLISENFEGHHPVFDWNRDNYSQRRQRKVQSHYG